MSKIITAVCAAIPDPLEEWLGSGGNMTLLFVGLIALGLYTWARSGAGEQRD